MAVCAWCASLFLMQQEEEKKNQQKKEDRESCSHPQKSTLVFLIPTFRGTYTTQVQSELRRLTSLEQLSDTHTHTHIQLLYISSTLSRARCVITSVLWCDHNGLIERCTRCVLLISPRHIVTHCPIVPLPCCHWWILSYACGCNIGHYLCVCVCVSQLDRVIFCVFLPTDKELYLQNLPLYFPAGESPPSLMWTHSCTDRQTDRHVHTDAHKHAPVGTVATAHLI